MLLPCSISQSQEQGREWEEAGRPSDVARVIKHLPEGTEVTTYDLPMRDGVSLATTVFIPPSDGAQPVLFCRGYYGRFNMAHYAREASKEGWSLVLQDARGTGDSKGKGSYDPHRFSEEQADIADTLDWVAEQAWCDGRVLMYGGSGNGINPSIALLVGHKALAGVSVSSTAPFAEQWSFENGVARWLRSWMKHRGLKVEDWPRPLVGDPEARDTQRQLAESAVRPDVPYVLSAGWYDILAEAAFEMYASLSERAPIIIKVEPRHHAGKGMIQGKPWPWAKMPEAMPKLAELPSRDWSPDDSKIVYYLMGDVNQPGGPGNCWKVTREWPVPSEPSEYFFGAGGHLSTDREAGGSSLSYRYDPSDPAPTIGGRVAYTPDMGPLDQRALATREDCLRFVTPPLESSLTITGLVSSQLRFATDREDTLFVVKLVDIYPDGYEALILESAAMARFSNELDGQTPLKPGTAYTLDVDLGHTALVFGSGHRIGVYVTSSAASENAKGKFVEAYQIHPNTFSPVSDTSGYQIATQKIFCGGQLGSRLVLPVVDSMSE
jgi:predicted acyl esterase